MNDSLRTRLGVAGVIVGGATFVVGFMAVHFVSLPEMDSVGRELYSFIPRGLLWEVAAKIVAFVGSQILIAGIVIGWLFDRELTWARASVGALLFSLEIVLYLAVIPNEWLDLTQSDLQWTAQREAFTIPPWLVLNNDVSVSFGAIKDTVSGTYTAVMLGVVLVAMYQYQEWNKRRGEEKPPKISSYGRPMVKGGR